MAGFKIEEIKQRVLALIPLDGQTFKGDLHEVAQQLAHYSDAAVIILPPRVQLKQLKDADLWNAKLVRLDNLPTEVVTELEKKYATPVTPQNTRES